MAETPDTDVAILLEQALRAHRQSGEHVRVPDATVATAIAEIARLRSELEAARTLLSDLLPYAKTCIPYPISVGEVNVIERAHRLLGGTCVDCGGVVGDHVSNYYCPEFRAIYPDAAFIAEIGLKEAE